MSTRICQNCRKRILPGKRQDARFCNDRCRVQHHRIQEREREQSQESAAPEKSLSRRAERRNLEAMLVRGAPAGALRYRLGMQQEHSLGLAYLPLGGAAYSLRPFQVPDVPRPGRYAVLYVDDTGAALSTPVQLAGGVYLSDAFVRRARRAQQAAVQP